MTDRNANQVNEKAKGDTMAAKDKGLVVTTSHRGVFFGYGEPSDADTIRLTDARMCVYCIQPNLKAS